MNFSLYDNLIDENDTQPISVDDKIMLIQYIHNFDKVGHELVYALIAVHWFNEHPENKDSSILPYESKILKSGIKFDIDRLPPILQHILVKFGVKHTERMQEENARAI